ncbi:hypothetical protein EG329_013784 [Mollisiaceae sp. DMI_Dod_QoI]|nr:hypothetical protein EG329_013784 [Helotiales sp. DMI_Dod_QoI]
MTTTPTTLDRFKEAMQCVYGLFETLPPTQLSTWTPPPKSGGHGGRYLWTDAFGVINFLTLYHTTSSPKYLTFARSLVESVHNTLGTTRDGTSRLPGASDNNPLGGGLRIGKLDEIGPDGDGQYHHYLTLWMFALNRLSVAASEPQYNRLAIQLAKAIHPRFVFKSELGGIKMVWKISMDMKKVLVPSEGHLDALTGYVVFSLLQEAEGSGSGVLKEQIEDYRQMMMKEGKMTVSNDPLDLGMGLWVCHLFAGREDWAAKLGKEAIVKSRSLLKETSGLLNRSPHYRLAFREFGLCLGIRCFDGDDLLNARVDSLLHFWEEYLKEVTADDLRPITLVMYAAALIPGAMKDMYWAEKSAA